MSEVPHPERAVGTTVVRNTAIGALTAVLLAPIPLLLTPYIVKHVGAQGLGVWSVLMALYSLTALGDVGLTGTLTKHVSEYNAARDYEKLNSTINAGIAIFVGIAIVASLTLIVTRSVLISTFFPELPVPAAQFAFGVVLVSLAIGCNLLAFPFLSVLSGLQRLDATNLISVLAVGTIALGTAAGLRANLGVMSFAYAILAGAALNLVASMIAVTLGLPVFRFSPRIVRADEVGQLFAFSLKMYVTQVAVVVHTNTEKFLLAHFSGLTPAGWYGVANDLALKIRSIPLLLLAPLLPAFADLEARGDVERMHELYRRSHKYLAVLGGLVLFGVCFLAEPFVRVWLGPGYEAVAIALVVLTAVQFLNLTSGAGMSVMIGRGDLRPGIEAALLGLVLNLVLSTILIIYYGFNGALYGTAISIVTGTVYFLVRFHIKARWPVRPLLQPYVVPVVWGLVLVFIGRFWISVPAEWIPLAAAAVGFGVVYLAGLLLMRYFDAADIHTLEQLPYVDKILRRKASAVA